MVNDSPGVMSCRLKGPVAFQSELEVLIIDRSLAIPEWAEGHSQQEARTGWSLMLHRGSSLQQPQQRRNAGLLQVLEEKRRSMKRRGGSARGPAMGKCSRCLPSLA